MEDCSAESDTRRALELHECAMRQACVRLRHMPATFRDQVIQVALVQRHWLLAAAVMDFEQCMADVYSTEDIEDMPPVRYDLMGAWTSDPSVVRKLMAAGIPVWFVRPAHRLTPDVHIEKTAPIVGPTQSDDGHTPSDYPVYHGLAGVGHLEVTLRPARTYAELSRYSAAGVNSKGHHHNQAALPLLHPIGHEESMPDSEDHPRHAAIAQLMRTSMFLASLLCCSLTHGEQGQIG